MPKRTQGDHLVAIHPGEFLREDYLVPMEMSANALAIALRVPATRIVEITHERRGISTDTAFRLSLFFGTTPEFWINMQTTYEVAIAKKELLPKIRKEVKRHVAQEGR